MSESPADHCHEVLQYSSYPGYHPPTCFFSPIHLCLLYHWHPHDLSMIKQASVHYLFATVQNVRNYLSDTLAMFVMIHTMFKLMNVLHWMHTRSQVDMLTCTLLVLTSLLCSAVVAALGHCKYSRFLCLHLSASSGVSLSILSLYCSLLHHKRPSISIQHEHWITPSIIQLTHAESVISSGNSPWFEPLHIPNMAKQ